MKLKLVAIASTNEKPYLREWVDYHMNLGFDVMVGLDKWTKQEIPDWLKEEGREIEKYTSNTLGNSKLDYVIVTGQKVQVPFYNFCIQHLGGYDWVLFIDIDEFYVGVSPFELVKGKEAFESIFMSWRFYGDSGQPYSSKNLSVLDRFKWCSDKPDLPSKQFINMKFKDRVQFYTPHIAIDVSSKKFIKSCYADGKEIKNIHIIVFNQPAEIAHFAVKTFPEFIMRKWQQSDAFYGSAKFNTSMDDLVKQFQIRNKNEIYKPII